MAGDEIVAKWLGDVHSSSITVTTAPIRFNATSKRFRDIKVFNPSSSHYFIIGQFFATSAEFEGKGIPLFALNTIEFKYIDLYDLGHCDSYGFATDLKLTVSNEY